jgi:hypothetical protein
LKLVLGGSAAPKHVEVILHSWNAPHVGTQSSWVSEHLGSVYGNPTSIVVLDQLNRILKAMKYSSS